MSECRRADKVNAHSSVTLAGQIQREQTLKPEVTFVRIAWESEAELVDELENCLHPRRPVQRNCRKIIWGRDDKCVSFNSSFLNRFCSRFFFLNCNLPNMPPCFNFIVRQLWLSALNIG